MKIFRAGAYESFYDMPLHVDWLLTRRCNYRCSYCFHYGKGKTTPPQLPFSTLEQLKNAVDNIASLNRPWYDIVFSGGEPTLHPHVFDLVEMFHETLKNRLNSLVIISNGSRNEKLYKNLAGIAKKIPLFFAISIHTDHVDMEHILELIETLSKDVSVYFALMFNPDKREEVYLIYDILYEYRKRFPFDMDVVLVRDKDRLDSRYNTADIVWQEEATKQFKALAEVVASKFLPPKESLHEARVFRDIQDGGERKIVESTDWFADMVNGSLNYNGMYCVAHAATMRIEEDGLCRGMVCSADPVICNIFEKGSLKAVREDLIHAVICPLHLCGCGSNDRIPKFTSRLEAARFIEVVDAKQQALFDAAQ